MILYFNRKSGEAIIVGEGWTPVAADMISQLPPERAADFERLTIGNVLHVRAINAGHLSVTSVPDGTI
jgi:hypothetical protein